MDLEQIGTIGVVVFALLGALSFVHQAREIWKNKSGEAISTILMIYFLFLYIASLFYGWQTDKWPIAFHGAIRIVVVGIIVYGLWKFKKFTYLNWLQIILLSFLVFFQIALPFKGEIFVIISVGSIVAASMQPIEMIKKKSKGVLSLPMFLVFLGASSFWAVYSVAVKDWFLFSISCAYIALAVVVIFLWFLYRKN